MGKKHFIQRILCIVLCTAAFFLSVPVYAIDLTSDSFIIRDPIIGTGGGYGSSDSFNLLSSGNTLLSGTGSSDSFFGRYGFLYFPYIVQGAFSAVANGADADLTWGAASAGLGWNIGGYNTGVASVSGGPYTYTDVGNVTSYSYTDLSPGEYCFVLQTYDALDNVIATSEEDCVTILPTITFDLDTAVSDEETNAPYSVALGSITTTDTRVSGSTDNINMIIAEANTNAPGGMVVVVVSKNGANGLVSASTPSHAIASADDTMADGTENYGLCVITAGLSGFSRAAPYHSGTCATNNEINDVQGLTTEGESILSASGALSDAHAEISVNAAISATTPAHADYSDTLTFIATPTF